MRLTRRLAAAPISMLAHALVFALLLGARSPPSGDFEEVGVAVSLVDGNAPMAAAATSPALEAAEPPPPAEAPAPNPQPPAVDQLQATPIPPAELEPLYVANESAPGDPSPIDDAIGQGVAERVALAAAAAAAASGEACGIGQWLQAALQADPAALAALARIPRPARSVANAMMLWDGRWIETGGLASSEGLTIRTAIVAGVKAAPQHCLDEGMRGPVLIGLADPTGTILLALGSGEWRWGDLAANVSPPALSIAQTRRH